MDDHTFCLLRLLDEKIRRAAILIEQHQIHVALDRDKYWHAH